MCACHSFRNHLLFVIRGMCVALRLLCVAPSHFFTSDEGNVPIFLLPPSVPFPPFLFHSSLSSFFYPVTTSCRCSGTIHFPCIGRKKSSTEEAICWLSFLIIIQTLLSVNRHYPSNLRRLYVSFLSAIFSRASKTICCLSFCITQVREQ